MPYFCGHALQRDHDELLMVGSDVRVLIDGRDFVLGRSYFVVPRLDGNAQLVQLAFGFEHASQNALGNCAEVMIFKFLALRRLGAKQGAAAVEQVGPRKEEVTVDQKVLLFRTSGRA